MRCWPMSRSRRSSTSAWLTPRRNARRARHGRDDARPVDHGAAIRRLPRRVPRPRQLAAAGWPACSAALLATWVTFAPCFLWIFLGAPYVERLRGNRALSAALAAITAAVVGVILNLAIWFAIHAMFRQSAGSRSPGAALASASICRCGAVSILGRRGSQSLPSSRCSGCAAAYCRRSRPARLRGCCCTSRARSADQELSMGSAVCPRVDRLLPTCSRVSARETSLRIMDDHVGLRVGLFNFAVQQLYREQHPLRPGAARVPRQQFGIPPQLAKAQRRPWARRIRRTASGNQPLVETASFGTNPGDLRMFSFVPPDLPAKSGLVVVLHGCTQTAAGYDLGAGWSTLARQYGFALLMPEQKANNARLCFNWFEPERHQRGSGEAARSGRWSSRWSRPWRDRRRSSSPDCPPAAR